MRTFTAVLLLSAALLAADRKTTTLAGNGTPGSTSQQVNNVYGLVVGPDGALYFCEIGNHQIRRLDLKTGQLSVVAGTGQKGFAGEGGLAKEATLDEPYELRFDKAGNLFFVDMKNNVVQRVDRKTKKITTVAGTGGKAGFSGDGGPAVQAELKQPHSIVFAKDGSLLICDIGNHRIRRVDLQTGTIGTYAGTGERKPTPDGSPLEGTPLNGPRALDVAKDGTLYLALREGNMILTIDPQTRQIHHLAGTGTQGYTGDGGPAKQAALSGPKGVALSPDGGLYIADTESHTIRRIDLKSGVITTVVGTGKRGDGPDGDPLQCKLSRPHGIHVDSKGVVYIGDSESHRIRKLQ